MDCHSNCSSDKIDEKAQAVFCAQCFLFEMSHMQQFEGSLELVEYFSMAIVSELEKSRKQFAALCRNTYIYTSLPGLL